MITKQIYLGDSYKKDLPSQIVDVQPVDEGRFAVVLRETIFYPMGGGQPTDQGGLVGDGWTGTVYQVLNKGDEIIHYVNAEHSPKVGELVIEKLNWDRRYKNMKMHSAGHLIDFALIDMGLVPQTLKPLEADHKKGWIRYQGEISIDLLPKIDAKANDLVAENLAFNTKFVDFDTLQKECVYVQATLPRHKNLRMLSLWGKGAVPDGGTQVNQTSEIGHIVVKKITPKNGETVIHYTIH